MEFMWNLCRPGGKKGENRRELYCMQLGIDGQQPHSHFRVAVNKTVGFNNGQVHVCHVAKMEGGWAGFFGVSCHYVCTFIKKLLHNESFELALQIVDAIYNSQKSWVRFSYLYKYFCTTFGQKWFFKCLWCSTPGLCPPFPRLVHIKCHSFHLSKFFYIDPWIWLHGKDIV